MTMKIIALAGAFLAAALVQNSAQAKLVEDHSEFTGTYTLVDGNVKECQVTLTLEGQPNAMVINNFSFVATNRKPQDVPVGRRDSLSHYVSNSEFQSIFVDNIDVPGVLVQITSTYQLLDNGGLSLVTTNSAPGPTFSTPARTECTYKLNTGY